MGAQVAPADAQALNLAFDVTPHDLVTAIITERGIARPPYNKSLPRIVKGEAAKGETAARPRSTAKRQSKKG